MFNIHVEMPMGNKSRGYDRENIDVANIAANRMISQMRTWAGFTADVVIVHHEGSEIYREHIANVER